MTSRSFTAAEFRMSLEFLGLDQLWVARFFEVHYRTVRRWVDGSVPVPLYVSERVRGLALETHSVVADLTESMSGEHGRMVVYADDAAFNEAFPKTKWSARWWRHVAARVSAACPLVMVDYPSGGDGLRDT